jgi:glucose/arabinose dehydrogenase
MLKRRFPFLCLTLSLAVAVAACGPIAGRPTPTGTHPPGTGAAQASPPPSTTPTAAAISTFPAPTTVPPTAPLTARPASATPSPPPAATSTPQPPAPTPTSPAATPTAPPRPDPAAARVELRRVLGGLDTPVGIAHAGDGSGWLFVVEKPGRIRIVAGSTLLAAPFLDIAGRVGSAGSEQGLLGLAFHPGYARNGLFFVNYTDLQGDTVVARFSVSADPARGDPANEAILLTVDQPAANHNGGHLAFGPDGYLYVGLGDGGGAGDRYGNGQNLGTLLGKMLRLDVDGGRPYALPPDNPFLTRPDARAEIWAFGLRNPWRYAFDRLTGDLYIADVGQDAYEEIDVQPARSQGGQNYGWPIMEGGHCYPENRACDRTGLALPVAEYDHSQGCSVTGGYVYRGKQFPSLSGVYLFADYCSGRIWGVARDGQGQWRMAELAQAGVRPSSFGEDEAGELYLVDMQGGELFQIAALPRP